MIGQLQVIYATTADAGNNAQSTNYLQIAKHLHIPVIFPLLCRLPSAQQQTCRSQIAIMECRIDIFLYVRLTQINLNPHTIKYDGKSSRSPLCVFPLQTTLKKATGLPLLGGLRTFELKQPGIWDLVLRTARDANGHNLAISLIGRLSLSRICRTSSR